VKKDWWFGDRIWRRRPPLPRKGEEQPAPGIKPLAYWEIGIAVLLAIVAAAVVAQCAVR